MLEVLRSMYAMTYDGEGTVVDKRRAKLYAARRRPPQGSRLVHVDTCRTARCLDVDHLKAELLIDPPPEPEHGRVWTRAIVTAVRPPASPAQPWLATYEGTKTRGDFPLNDKALEALGIAEGGTLALEHEVLLISQPDKAGPVEVNPVPGDDEWLTQRGPGHRRAGADRVAQAIGSVRLSERPSLRGLSRHAAANLCPSLRLGGVCNE